MNRGILFGGVALVVASVLFGGRVLSQDKGDAKQPDEATMPWMKFAEPGEFHKHLEPLIGKWNQNVKWWMAPGTEPQISTGTSEYKWILGKRFVQQTVRGEMEGEVFEGLGLIGYDNFKKKYTSMWTDSMSTSIMTNLGTCDASGKVFNFTGRLDDVMTGKSDQPFRNVVRIINRNKHIDEMYMTSPTGKEFQVLEIVYTRIQ